MYLTRVIELLMEWQAAKEGREWIIMGNCHPHIQLPASCPQDIHQSDNFMLHWEGRDLMAPHPAPWRGEGEVLPVKHIEPMTSEQAEMAFLLRFQELTH